MAESTTEKTAGSSADKVTIAIDPVTRIEGHLKVEVTVESGKVTEAKLTGGMYRGFESILRGRHPRDAAQIVQRICGVCPTAHATASSLALEKASGIPVPANGRIVRNLILGANYIQSHLLHFYHLAGQDFIMGPDTPPFTPRYKNPDLRLPSKLNAAGVDQYLEALEIRAVCHEMAALFGGRMPHVHGILAGGTAQIPTRDALAEYAARFKKVRPFVEEKYLPVIYAVGAYYKDLATFGQGARNALCVGVFPLNDAHSDNIFNPGVYLDGEFEPLDPSAITEEVGYSWFADSTSGKGIGQSRNIPDLNKPQAYSFVKAPLYKGKPMEVGPLARMWINNKPLSPVGRKMLHDLYSIEAASFRDLGEELAFSVLGRHIARAEETWQMLGHIENWLREAEPGEQTFTAPEIPADCEGYAFTEAPRGSLLHFIRVRGGKIDNYQIISATLWNAAPRNDAGVPGAMEQALLGTPVPDIESPVNVARVIRAFDP